MARTFQARRAASCGVLRTGAPGARHPNGIADSVRLTQIRLSGFKSFVDPTSIHFPGTLVGVVGPNGCGKSNVIDAVRWVLGESRAAALRGDSMQDVIFNGSGNRKPMHRASVELMFDNSLGRAAGQWSQYAEISVRRVLQRDGESSYFINNTHVRRRDVTDMFLGTGLGPRAYAIIEQGMIQRVIEARPEDLRMFLEEAAGVSRYRERRRETESRLADTRENLARVNDIRQELGAQIERLDGQARVATQYREYQQTLQLKQQLLWFLRRRDAAAERERHAGEIARASVAMEAETARLREVESRIESARAAHFEAGDALNAAQAALYGANAEVARHESELRHVEENRQRIENRHTERRAQLTEWREQRAQLTQALHLWVARSAQARQRTATLQQRLAEENERLPRADQEHRTAQERLNEARSRVLRAEGGLQLEQAARAHIEHELQSVAQRRERLEGELHALQEPGAGSLSGADERLRALDAALARAQDNLNAAQAAAAEILEQRAAGDEALAQATRERTAAEAQLATLQQVQAAAEENAPLREWLERHSLAALPRCWQKIRIEAGWETAVEAILHERLHALELADGDALAPLAADRPPVKASVFERGEAAAPVAAHGLTPLAARVHLIDLTVGGALADWFAGVYTCDGVPDAAQRSALPPGTVVVNRKGDRFTRYSVSFHAPDPADAGILARQAEIDALELRCSELRGRHAAAQGAADQIEAQARLREEVLETARAQLAARQAERHEAELEQLRLRQALERFRERKAQIQSELAELATESGRDQSRLEACVAALGRLAEALAAERAALEAVHDAHLAAERALGEQRRTTQQAERDLQDAVFGERECVSKIAEIENSVAVIDQQIVRAEAETTELAAELSVDPLPALRRSRDVAVEARIACEKTLAAARDRVEAAAGTLRALEEERLQVEAGIAPLRERIGELRLREQAAQINHEQFAAQLRDGGADEARLAGEAEQAPRPATLQGEITRLSQAIGELGAVNLAAVEELKSSSERKSFLDAQADDLTEAVTTLEDAIRRIDRETRELLRETFEVVDRHFGSLFPVLFGGGEAKLLMTGEEILDAGVQVMAHPPGKRNSTIQLLSGGEKTLTAIALVFAIFQLNPAPFCLLDEVDAPLDDANTLRFCDLVRKMSAQTQFLFITHNKITMELAAQLIGVTMPEPGVSRVVAVDIDEALRLREELAA
jgi:chromosome segregation protein